MSRFTMKGLRLMRAIVAVICVLFIFALAWCVENCPRIERPKPGDYTSRQSSYQQYVVLEVGQTHAFDIPKLMENATFSYDTYSLLPTESYTIKDNSTITVLKSGRFPLSAKFYDKADDDYYSVQLGEVYAYDRSELTPVSTAEELTSINDNLEGKYILTSDIDLGGIENWEPIGNLPDRKAFSGTFINPDGYKIKNLTIKTSTKIHNGIYGGCYAGLFGKLDNTFLYGIKLENVQIDVSDFAGDFYADAGGLAGFVTSSFVKSCSVSGSIKTNGDAGGIVGSSNHSVYEDCSFTGTVTLLEKDYVLDPVNTNGAGGLAGYFYHSDFNDYYLIKSINRCTVNGTVTAKRYAGGLVGYISGENLIHDSSFNGTLSGERTGEFYAIKHWP